MSILTKLQHCVPVEIRIKYVPNILLHVYREEGWQQVQARG